MAIVERYNTDIRSHTISVGASISLDHKSLGKIHFIGSIFLTVETVLWHVTLCSTLDNG
jgi:hypothetical protein